MQTDVSEVRIASITITLIIGATSHKVVIFILVVLGA
jgi:hypothetical protein